MGLLFNNAEMGRNSAAPAGNVARTAIAWLLAGLGGVSIEWVAVSNELT